jgi:hypothetical protein
MPNVFCHRHIPIRIALKTGHPLYAHGDCASESPSFAGEIGPNIDIDIYTILTAVGSLSV